MKVLILVLIFTVICINLHAQTEKNISNVNDFKYNLKLIKFYIEKYEYENALEYIDKTLEETIEKDSLYYFKAFIYKELEDWLQTSEFFAKAILHSSEEKVIDELLTEFEIAIVHVSPLSAFDIVSAAVANAQNTQKHVGFLNILARLYEDNQLYGEANDVYKTLLLETEESESYKLQIKIATNNIFQKDYEEALNILEPLIVLNDSLYIEQLLFLNYISNISLEYYDNAKTSLIRLYVDFPEHSNREEIIAGLADIFKYQEQYLMSWYMLNELFKISDEARRFKILHDIERIKEMICESKTIEDQFKYFIPILEFEENGSSPEDIE